jgi:hypothetical protein
MENVKVEVVVVGKEKEFVSYQSMPLAEWVNAHTMGSAGTASGTVEKFVASERLLTHGFLMDTMRKLMGKTLTIIDASVSGPQNKAMKDLVRGTFSDEMGFAAEWAFDQKNIEDLEDLDGADAVSIEEALGVQ